MNKNDIKTDKYSNILEVNSRNSNSNLLNKSGN